jgi:HNH endonuclease
MRFTKYTEEQLKEAIASSKTIASVLSKLSLAPKGGNYRTIHRYIKKLNIDTSHMIGQSWSKNQIIGPKRPIEDYLTNKRYIASNELKRRLLNEQKLERICNNCHNTQWLENPIPLELHHIDGNSDNNTLSNLQLLCPNCHTLTDNYRGRGKKSKYIKRKRKYVPKNKSHQESLPVITIAKPDGRANPRPLTRKVIRPDYETLLNEIKQHGFSATGRKYNVSDNAIRKWIKIYEKYQVGH